MYLSEVVLRLRATCPSFNRYVGGAAYYAGVANETYSIDHLPCAFVTPSDESAVPPSGNLVSQDVAYRFIVSVILSSQMTKPDGQGYRSYISLETVRQELFASLLGWEPIQWRLNVPTEYPEPWMEDVMVNSRSQRIHYRGGQMAQLSTTRMQFDFEFETSLLEGQINPDKCRSFREIEFSDGVDSVSIGTGFENLQVRYADGTPVGIDKWAYDATAGTFRRTDDTIPNGQKTYIWFESDGYVIKEICAAYYPELLQKAGGNPAEISLDHFDLISDIPEGTAVSQTPISTPGQPYNPGSAAAFFGVLDDSDTPDAEAD